MEFKCNNVTITLKNGKVIVANLSFVLNSGDKMAVIGEEGNGKSTVVKYLVSPHLIDSYCLYQGVVSNQDYRIGYLMQSLDEYKELNSLSFILMDIDGVINYDLYEQMYRITKLFNDYKLELDILERNISTLSGGEKLKLQLIKLEFHNASLLIMDEPTNDIDLSTMLFLENYICKTDKPIIYVSHDLEFLKNSANIILHLEQIKRKTESLYTLKRLPYEEYLHYRQIKFQRQNDEAYREEKIINEKKEQLRKFKQKIESQMVLAVRAPSWGRLLAKKMKVVTGQEKKVEIENKNKTEYAAYESDINVRFEDDLKKIHNSKKILDFKNVQLSIGNKILASNIDLVVRGREHLCIIGNNGIGKTTLLRRIRSELENTPAIKVGYFSQDYDEVLDYNSSVVDFLLSNITDNNTNRGKVMTYLSAVNFLEHELSSRIGELSSGQKAKVLLLKLIIEKCNVLLLDEPTRNMSSFSAPKMCEILAQFPGTIVAISHDRLFIKTVCDELYQLHKTGLKKINSNTEFD